MLKLYTERGIYMKILKSQRGISLVEVVAAIVIIGIILISFSQLLIQSNKLAHKNTEKLVTIQLADAMLERLKANPSENSSILEKIKPYCPGDNTLIKPEDQVTTEIVMNSKTYHVTYFPSQCSKSNTFQNTTNTDLNLKLVRVVVTVTAPNGKTKGSTEGYVSLE